MKKIVPIFIFIGFAACRNQSANTGGNDSLTEKKDSINNEPFYPITQYIQDQIAYVDSTPLAIEKITFIDNKRVDSVIIDRQAFHLLAEEFLKPDLNDKNIKPFYTENSYRDLTINSVTFNYTTTDRSQELQQADILLNPENNRVKNVIFRKNRIVGDTAINVNGLWKHNMNFQLNYTLKPPKGKAVTKQVKVIWDRPMPENF